MGTSGKAGSGAPGTGLSIWSRGQLENRSKGMLESASEAGLLDSNSKEHDVQSNPEEEDFHIFPSGWLGPEAPPGGQEWNNVEKVGIHGETKPTAPSRVFTYCALPIHTYFFLPPSPFSSFDQTGVLIFSRHPLIS